MKILRKDIKHGRITVVPETLDDLWTLYNIILPKDQVHARTSRGVKIEEEGARPTKGKRISLSLTLRAEEVEFDRMIDRLRVKGVVTEAPEDLGIQGNYHTISIPLGKPVTVIKEEWHEHHLDRLKVASDYKATPIIVVALDDEDCGIAVLRQYGFDVKSEMRVHLPGKLEVERREESKLGYFKSATTGLLTTWKKDEGPIVIVGPGFIKNEFANYLRDRYPELAGHVAAVKAVSSGGVGGIQEAMRVGALTGIVRRLRVAEETEQVEEIFARFGQGREDVTYGMDGVEKAATYGSVDRLFVSIKLLREGDEEVRSRIEEMIRMVERMRGRVTIISDEHEAGKKLLGLGGIAALLRFSVVEDDQKFHASRQ